jgi:hypothetical protein
MPETPSSSASALPAKPKTERPPEKITLVPYPKIVFLYPTLVVSFLAAIYTSLVTIEPGVVHEGVIVVSVAFLVVLGLNLMILAFDFPRAYSLTILFMVIALGLGASLLFVKMPDLLPQITAILKRFNPVANSTFYWTMVVMLGLLTLAGCLVARFDFWEARPNELLHHHGLWGNLERFSSPGLRIDKEINDVFEYLLLGSGRLILHPSNERKAIVLDNVPFIRKKEIAIMRMLSALQVEVRTDNDDGAVPV